MIASLISSIKYRLFGLGMNGRRSLSKVVECSCVMCCYSEILEWNILKRYTLWPPFLVIDNLYSKSDFLGVGKRRLVDCYINFSH